MHRIIVLGIGNTLNRDEGVGVHAVRALEAQRPRSPVAGQPSVEYLDGGALGLNLLPIVEEASHLLILDAVDAHQPPGAVIELAGDEIPLFSGIKLSQHQITFQEVLGLAAVRGKLPAHLRLIGVQPADLEIGLDLSPTIAAALPEVVARACAVLAEWMKTPVQRPQPLPFANHR
jgi:hydrogenase maturation protease